VKSRYNGLRTIGTLALILAWIVLILGIIMGIASWLGLSAIQNTLSGFDLNVNLGPLPILGIIPGLLWGILGFLVYYAIGKTLHLLVDVDERTMQLRTAVEQPAAADDSGGEMSGELKRQAKLIAANLEATQDIQRQLTAIENKMGMGQVSAPAAAVAVVAAAEAAEVHDDAEGDEAAEESTPAGEEATETEA
jgi:hypothetical protein